MKVFKQIGRNSLHAIIINKDTIASLRGHKIMTAEGVVIRTGGQNYVDIIDEVVSVNR